MSVSATIDIHLSESIQKGKSAIEIIQVLINFGWTFSTNGYVCYLPLGDKDNFNWQEKKISFEKLNNILKEKEVAKEVIGVTMTWQDTHIGGTFLFWTDEKYETFSLGISIDRQEIILQNGYKITDFQWYLSKLLIPLSEFWEVEYFSFYQHV